MSRLIRFLFEANGTLEALIEIPSLWRPALFFIIVKIKTPSLYEVPLLWTLLYSKFFLILSSLPKPQHFIFHHTVSIFLPFLLLLLRTFRPPLVAILFLNPCFLFLLILDVGLNVFFTSNCPPFRREKPMQ